MKLTDNFTSDEFKVSSSYPELAAKIELTPEDLTKVYYLAAMFLQPVRDEFGTTRILSGKRSLELNTKVGGAAASDHLYTGGTPKAAVDFTLSPDFLEGAYEFLRFRAKFAFGQLIYYRARNFIHVSLPTPKHHSEAWINE